jgi:hypothetical protein
MAPAPRFPGRLPLILIAAALVASGCRLAPREQVDECHRLSQTLRSENAKLKDQMLALRSQNEDYSERAVDDARRLAQLETVNQRLETSVQAYQDERTRLESAYKELRASLPDSLKPVSMGQSEPSGVDRPIEKTSRAAGPIDPEVSKAGGSAPAKATRTKRKSGKKSDQGSWAPAQSDRHPDTE